MSQPNGLLILGDNLFLNYIVFWGQRGLINIAGLINPNLTLLLLLLLLLYIYRLDSIPLDKIEHIVQIWTLQLHSR